MAFRNTLKSTDFETEIRFQEFIDSIYALRIQKLEENESVSERTKSHFLQAINSELKTAYCQLAESERNFCTN